jgi:carbonic anhydrase/acetyltransferase-like protein (isoleucine patch superfamily)
MFPGTTVLLKESAHIGHGAVIHGATIGRNSLVGMNSVVMDNAVIGDECIVGALTFVPEGMQVDNRKIAVGNPAKIIKEVTDEMINWKTRGTALYQQLPSDCFDTLRPCEPLRRVPAFVRQQQNEYKTWGKEKRRK